ncbi:hypothetical protein Hanom_Chr01g00033151 [Helianthus anomalus]
MVDEGYTRRIKIGRSRDQFFFCRPWVKVVEEISFKFATRYVGDRKFKLTMFSPDGTHCFLQIHNQFH